MDRVATAPISWGVCEVPGWGVQLPVSRVLAEMRELGFTHTELGSIGWLPTDPVALRALLDDADLRLLAGFVPLPLHEPSRLAEAREAAARAAELLAGGGAEFFVTAVVSDPDDWARPEISDDRWDFLCGQIDELESLIADHGLRQVVHPHVGTLVETADEIQRVVDRTAVSFVLDTAHFTLGGVDPLDFARRHGDRVGLVHLKDIDTVVADRFSAGELSLMEAVQHGVFPPLGRGDIPIAEIVREIESHGGRWYVIEQDAAIVGQEPAPDVGPKIDVCESIEFLRELAPTLVGAAPGQIPTTQEG